MTSIKWQRLGWAVGLLDAEVKNLQCDNMFELIVAIFFQKLPK